MIPIVSPIKLEFIYNVSNRLYRYLLPMILAQRVRDHRRFNRPKSQTATKRFPDLKWTFGAVALLCKKHNITEFVN